ncbi:MAG: hypothetical protein JW873_02275 [Candidatus Saganbacteria bacterium]|nr:hypothetical protein [Candidatus Saganbacteria bacterium]
MKRESAREPRGFQLITDLAVLLLIAFFLLSYFEPKYLFSPTITTGGDTGSHYYTAVYLKEALLPAGRIMGWLPGNYAGFPLFYHYFPLPFILMALLSFILPLTIAFKLVTVLGIFLLPLCVYLAFRLLKYPFPVPVCGAALTLPFLFMEANSMWGANIPSTLAGEFSYGLGSSLLFLFFGALYSGINENNKVLLNAGLVLLLGLSHGYAIIAAVLFAGYFLFSRAWLANLKYLAKVFGLGFLLLGFWLVPFFGTLPYVTEYVTAWRIASFREVLPRILFPGLVLSLAALWLNRRDRRSWYFIYSAGLCLIFYFLGPRIGLLDIRFIPLCQIFLAVFGATLPLAFLGRLNAKPLLAAVTLLAILLWVSFNVTYIKSWIEWNYTGFEGKRDWPLFQQINGYLRRTGPGRVVYEHSPSHNRFGTERAFESLPFFAQRDTLEGLYMQSSPSAPFVFYLQSQVSQLSSGPFPQYQYTHLDLARALPRLKLFGVTQYLARSPAAKKAAAATPGLKLEAAFGNYQLYRLTGSSGRYVAPLDHQPVLLFTNNWRRDFYDWWKRDDRLSVPLVSLRRPGPNDLKHFPLCGADWQKLPAIPLSHPAPVITERLGSGTIDFDTNLIGYPHLIKVSYHPNWRAEGADKIYLVAPSFMLVYPRQTHVRLVFGRGFYDYLGALLTLAGLAGAAISVIISSHGRQQRTVGRRSRL